MIIDYPTKPKEEFHVFEDINGKIPVYVNVTTSYDIINDKSIFLTAEGKHSQKYYMDKDRAFIETVYTHGCINYLDTYKASLKYYKKIELINYEGVEYLFVGNEGKLEGKVKTVFIEDRVYSILVLYPANNNKEGEREKFFNSFKIKE